MALWGLPYQGSKGRFAPMIFRAISQRHGDRPRVLVDPFTGGFAVGHYFSHKGWEVRASDVDRYQIALLSTLLDGPGVGPLAERWVTREEFIACRDDPESTGLTDAEVQFIRLVWSFGNSGSSYLYGRHLEETKRLTHALITSGTVSERLADLTKVSVTLQERIAALSSPAKRYVAWGRAYRGQSSAVGRSTDDERRRRRVDRLTSPLLQSFTQARRAGLGVQPSVEQSKDLERSSRVQGVQGVQGVQVTLQSYEQALADAPEGAAIYLDPPYADTEGYRGAGGTFDHDLFWKRAEEATRTHPVYVSEYRAPDGWKSILSFNRAKVMAADSRAKSDKHREHLFCWSP